MTNRLISFLFLFVFPYCGFSQKISGVVVSGNAKIPNARVLLKKQSHTLAYTFTDSQGAFTFKEVPKDSLLIEVAHLNYETYSISLKNDSETPLVLELIEKTNFLEEVYIKKDIPIRQKKDTLVYNLAHFKDGTERVIEDLLKKLPGITVNDQGKIAFKGKEIQALMIDGDDLFNSRYTIGSKNLDADYVESVEAIENFNPNKVLHKITETDKVAINLKLKKGLPVLTARGVFENDFHSKYDNSITTLLLHSKYKGFSFNGINNIGNGNQDDITFIDAQTSNKSKVRSLISEGDFPQFLGERNSLLNNAFATNNSLKTKISKQASSTFGINYYKDRLSQDINNATQYLYEDQDFTYINTDHQVKKPEFFSVSNQIEYYNGKDIQLNTNFVIGNRQSDLTNNATNNNVLGESNVNTKRMLVGGKAEITKLMHQNSALKFHVVISQNHSEQRFFLSPAINVNESILADRQFNDVRTDYFESQAQYYRNWDKIKLKITNTTESKIDGMKSQLKNQDVIATGFENDIAFHSLINQFATEVTFGYKRFKFGIGQILWFSKTEAGEKGINDFSYLFRTEARYAITKKHSLQFSLFRQLEIPSIENVFEAPVLTSYRSVSSNQGTMDNIKNTEASLNYTISDFYNTFYFKASVNYTYKDKDYYNITELSPMLTYNRTVLLDQGNDRTTFNISLHKLVPFLKLNFKYNVFFSISTFYNFVDDSDLRSVKSKMLSNELIFYKTINKKLLLNNKTNFDSNFFRSDDGQQNNLTQIKNEFKVDYKLSQAFNLKSSLQTFIPDNQKSRKYNFLGFDVSYDWQKFNCEVYIRGQNLLNHKTFNSTLVSDYAVSSFSYRLQERNVLLGLLFKIF